MMIFESAARWRTSPSMWQGTALIVAKSTRLTWARAPSPMVAARSAMAAIRHRWPCRRDTISNSPSWGRARDAEPAVLGHPRHVWRDRSALVSGDFPVRNLRFPEDLDRKSQPDPSK